MTPTEKMARIERLRDLIRLLRANAHEGHMPYRLVLVDGSRATPYVADALELIVDLLGKDIG